MRAYVGIVYYAVLFCRLAPPPASADQAGPPSSGNLTAEDVMIEKIVKHHKGKTGGWKPGRTSASSLKARDKRRLAGAIKPTMEEAQASPRMAIHTHRAALPDTFDAREAWPICPSIHDVRSQGRCASCWAQAGAMAISDRICIASGGNTIHQASVQDLLVCTGPYYGSTNLCDGCQTIWPYGWWVSFGIVTGGPYNSSSGCMPYTSYTESAAASTSSSSCSHTCTNPAYPKAYSNDRNKGYSYYIVGNGLSSGLTITPVAVIDQIKSDLLTYGPMSVEIDVYDDFYHYSSGVYQHVTGAFLGRHSMRLIGWGTEHTQDYWLIINSWGTRWGMNGTVKIVRGKNECQIEDYVVAGRALPGVPPKVNLASSPIAPPVSTMPKSSESTTRTTILTSSTTAGVTTKSTAVTSTAATTSLLTTTIQLAVSSTTNSPSSTTTSTTTTSSLKSTVPDFYDTCDIYFCSTRPNGYYQIHECSRNYCKCTDGTGKWLSCAVGKFFEGSPPACKVPSSTWCPIKSPSNLVNAAAWPTASTEVLAMCNVKNCANRGVNGQSTSGSGKAWYTLGRCAPYWCMCNAQDGNWIPVVQTCPAGQRFDFRSESYACVDMNILPWCN